MCGIAGFVGPTGSVDRDELTRMRDAIAHRGPDDAGLFIDSDRKVGLAHRRLSIIDLSPSGHQPMADNDELVWLVFNGEIYNFQEIRTELRALGYSFRSQSDTEVIIYAYLEWGFACLQKLRGMFAFALWDTRDQSLFFARDRFGIKPFLYCHSDDRFAFGSELKAITSLPGLQSSVDKSAIFDFFTYGYIPTPKTIYSNIRKLPPAHFGILRDGSLQLHEYWDVQFDEPKATSFEEARDSTLDALEEALRLHLIADVPVGVMLSGGLDSSTLVAMTALKTTEPLHTFTIGFDVADHDERKLARLTAERYATVHHEKEINFATVKRLRQRIIDIYDEPFADTSSVPTYLVSELARTEVKVAISGEGGDEVFAGYKHYFKWLRFSLLASAPDWLRSVLLGGPAKLLPDGAKGKWSLSTAALPAVPRYAGLLSALTHKDRNILFAEEFLREFRDYDPYWYWRKYWREDLDPLSRMQYVDIKTSLHDKMLTKVDRASMAVSLEARVPMLDHIFVERVASIPGSIRNKGSSQKALLREVARDLLPNELFSARKRGFSAPIGAWLKDEPDASIGAIDTSIFSAEAADRGMLDEPRYYWNVQLVNTWLLAN